MSRDQILSTLRTSLVASREFLAREAGRADHTPPPYVLPPQDDLGAQFVAEIAKLEGKAYPVRDNEEALETIAALLQAKAATTALAWDLDQIGLPGLDALLRHHGVTILAPDVQGDQRADRLQELEPAPVCLSGVELAIAESGSLALRHGPGRPRLASLLAPAHIAIVRRSQLVRGLGEALATLGERYGAALFDPTSNLTFITGPSRTADIEMTLSLGIHGPPEVHVILIDADQ
jgi:L-lactate dehydrogenase complex protein LldG